MPCKLHQPAVTALPEHGCWILSLQVQYVSVPLSSDQAGHSLKPNMFAFNEDQVTTSYYEQHCQASNTLVASTARHLNQLQYQHSKARVRVPHSGSDPDYQLPVLQLHQLITAAVGFPPEWDCERLSVGDNDLGVPIPVMPVHVFKHMIGALEYSYEAFKEVRERLKV